MKGGRVAGSPTDEKEAPERRRGRGFRVSGDDMPRRPAQFRPHGSRPKAEIEREADARRGSARDRGYDTRWEKARLAHLARHATCEYCALEGKLTAANTVDHLYPKKLYPEIAWHSEWWVSTCGECHNGMKQALEHRGRSALDALARRLGRPVLAHPRGVVESPGARP